MQLHQLHSTYKSRDRKRVGRGGKRGTYSGHGSKGQKSRAGHRIRPGFRGGDNPIWKLFPKQRGAGKKTDIKHSTFRVSHEKPAVVNFSELSAAFRDGDVVSKKTLMQKGLIRTAKKGVKILGGGVLNKKLIISGLNISKNAAKKVSQAGGSLK